MVAKTEYEKLAEEKDLQEAIDYLQRRADRNGNKAERCHGSSWAPVFAKRARYFQLAADALREKVGK